MQIPSLKHLLAFIVYLLGLPVGLMAEDSKMIVYLVSPPRSVSTAFLRMIEARGDFKVFNEPYEYAYSSVYYPHYADQWFDKHKQPLPTLEAVKEKLLETSQTKPVFVKEMSDVAYHFLKDSPQFVENPNVQFLFIVRDPHEIAVSYYKKDPKAVPDMEIFIGTQILYDVFKLVLEKSPNKPGIIFTDKLINDPTTTAESLANHLGIPYKPEALSWTPYSNAKEGSKHWNEVKKDDEILFWHDHALQSSGFEALTTYDRDEEGNMTFIEIEDEADRKALMEASDIHDIYFNEMKEYTDYHI